MYSVYIADKPEKPLYGTRNTQGIKGKEHSTFI